MNNLTPSQQLDKLLACKHCPRLRHNFINLKAKYPAYWNQPVPPSGEVSSAILIVGLAPGLHGANQTGIPFTGDASGELLFSVLNELGLAEKVRITNAVKCVPPQNLPLTSELKNCSKFLAEEIKHHISHLVSGHQQRVIFCLGLAAHKMTLKHLGLKIKDFPFAHNADYTISPNVKLVSSYHCSRYNTQTGRLTREMFLTAVAKAANFAGLS